MADGVLHDRLEQQHRHARPSDVVFDAKVDGKTIPEARILDLQIAVEDLELFLQRDLRAIFQIERHAEQVAEADDHGIGGGGIVVDQLGDGVQGVEEEVRLELHAQ